eukprot:7671912-Lingulodinium_polyedra.AAC.1
MGKHRIDFLAVPAVWKEGAKVMVNFVDHIAIVEQDHCLVEASINVDLEPARALVQRRAACYDRRLV